MNTVYGYVITWTMEAIAASVIVGTLTFINTLYYALCSYIETMIQDAINTFRNLDKIYVNELQLSTSLKDAILFHNTVIK